MQPVDDGRRAKRAGGIVHQHRVTDRSQPVRLSQIGAFAAALDEVADIEAVQCFGGQLPLSFADHDADRLDGRMADQQFDGPAKDRLPGRAFDIAWARRRLRVRLYRRRR